MRFAIVMAVLAMAALVTASACEQGSIARGLTGQNPVVAPSSATATIPPGHVPIDENAHQAQPQAKEQATCARVGGRWGSSLYHDTGCQLTYRSPVDGQSYFYWMTFDAEGKVIPTPGMTESDCKAGRVGGPGVTTYWHADTMICAT